MLLAAVNDDGFADAVRSWAVLPGSGTGDCAAAVPGGAPGFLVHLDGDRTIDNLTPAYGDMEPFYVRPGRGDGSFGPALGFAAGGSCLAFSLADLNGDGANDLVCGNARYYYDDFPRPKVSMMLNLGDGTFTPPQSLATDHSPSVAAAADVNQDGWPDILAAGNCGSIGRYPREEAPTLSVWLAQP